MRTFGPLRAARAGAVAQTALTQQLAAVPTRGARQPVRHVRGAQWGVRVSVRAGVSHSDQSGSDALEGARGGALRRSARCVARAALLEWRLNRRADRA